MKIGIDFGSTYSTLSSYLPDENRVVALKLDATESEAIPSVVCVSKNGRVSCGFAAKVQVGRRNCRVFEAFKMLLNESDNALLSNRGYDDKYSPREVSRLYLGSLLQRMLDNYAKNSSEHFEEIVVCVPEVWCNNVRTQDGRSILRDILLNEIKAPVDSVRVVTEPEAASAYLAYHYEKETGLPFNGHLLLIDYGGGTLDLTLTRVESFGNGNMETSFRAGGGAGENHDGSLGSAGVAYMQTVVALAIKKNTSEENIDYTDPAFLGCVRDLESQLKSSDRMKEIAEYFGSFGSGYEVLKSISEEDDEEFILLDFKDDELSISYLDLLRAYMQTIEKTLNDEIIKINKEVQKRTGIDPCSPKTGTRDDFKIALVGGFGSFYLVKKQLGDIYNLDFNEKLDKRTKNVNAEGKELAISYGAALMAAGVVAKKRVARFSIGLYTASHDGVYRPNYAIRYLQEVEPETTYYILRDKEKGDVPGNRMVFGALYQNIKHFVINFTDDTDKGGLMALKQAMIKKLERIPQEGYWYCGFSLDKNDIVVFHASSARIGGHSENHMQIDIPLDNYSGMFELTAIKEVSTK